MTLFIRKPLKCGFPYGIRQNWTLSVSRDTNQLDKANSSLISSRNFQRDGGRPTAFDMQVLIANHFLLLKWKLIGGERKIESLSKDWQGK